jgi:hypothetical protein
MEYLPEKKRTQKTQILKKEQKISQFRQELVDNNVVLAIVKCKSLLQCLGYLANFVKRCDSFGVDEELVAVTRGPHCRLHGLRWKPEEFSLGRHGSYGR